MQAGFKFVKSFDQVCNYFNLLFWDNLKHCIDHDQGVEKVVNGTFAFLNSEGALR